MLKDKLQRTFYPFRQERNKEVHIRAEDPGILAESSAEKVENGDARLQFENEKYSRSLCTSAAAGLGAALVSGCIPAALLPFDSLMQVQSQGKVSSCTHCSLDSCYDREVAEPSLPPASWFVHPTSRR